jgi:hypothetical protein
MPTVPIELNVLALIKGDEKYVFVYDDSGKDQLLDALREQAGDARLSLNWFDADVLTRKAIEQTKLHPADDVEDRGRIPEAS